MYTGKLGKISAFDAQDKYPKKARQLPPSLTS
jgi:hypothetical protein